MNNCIKSDESLEVVLGKKVNNIKFEIILLSYIVGYISLKQ